MNKTINYYNENVDAFVENTVNADMSVQYALFEKYLQPDAHILDLGCGSGRDTKYFLNKGYTVTAVDGSEELCKKATEITGTEVRNILFSELDYTNEFDGIWACSSLLHVPYNDLPEILNKVVTALKLNGVFYTSFKYGNYQGERNGRYFTDLTEESFQELIKDIPDIQIIDKTITGDVREGREDEKWLNVVLKKIM